MLLICPVRPGDTNEELRYALRSWETNLHLGTPLQLMTVGYKPNWLEPDEHVDGNLHKSMPLNVFDNVFMAAVTARDELEVEDVVYMNDDFFCLDPVGAILPVKRNCSLAEHVKMAGGENSGSWWGRSLALTASWLDGLGFPQPDSYEVHRPLLATASGMIEALGRWNLADTVSLGGVPQWRTAYGVLNKIEAYPVIDAKLGPRSPGVGTPWVSTSDQTWRRYALDLRRRFQKPSRWER